MMKKYLYDGPIVDAHAHFQDPARACHPGPAPATMTSSRAGDYPTIARKYLPDDYASDMKAHWITETVYVEAAWRPGGPIGETSFAHELARHSGWPNAMVAKVSLQHDDADAAIAAQAGFPLVRSVRDKVGGTLGPDVPQRQCTLMSDERWRRGYAELGRHGLNFDLLTPWWNLGEAGRLASEFPRTTIILNHAGLPTDRTPAGLQGWRTAMAALSMHSNVAVKISGLGALGQAWSVEGNAPVVRDVLDRFGDERVMFGSNFPVDRRCASFDDIFAGFKQIVSDRSPTAQERIFYANARRLYRTTRLDQDQALPEE